MTFTNINIQLLLAVRGWNTRR